MNHVNFDKYTERKKIIVKTSVMNMLATFVLATVKVVVGLLSNSMAMVMDAVNYYYESIILFL